MSDHASYDGRYIYAELVAAATLIFLLVFLVVSLCHFCNMIHVHFKSRRHQASGLPVKLEQGTIRSQMAYPSLASSKTLNQNSSHFKSSKSKSSDRRGIDEPDAIVRPSNRKSSPFKLFSLFRSQNRQTSRSGRRTEAKLSSAPCLYQSQLELSDPTIDKCDSYESFETTTTDSEFYRDWRHSIDFGTSPVLNPYAANNNQALQLAYEQLHSPAQALPTNAQPELTDENATELIYTVKHSSRMRNSLFGRFMRRPLQPTIDSPNQSIAADRYVMQNEWNKQRNQLLTSTPRNHDNRTGALDTNMNVLYI